MRRALRLVAVTLVSWGTLSAQEVRLGVSALGLDFHAPSSVALESYSMVATTLTIEYPVRSWLTTGARLQWGSATLRSRTVKKANVTGMTDTELFGAVQVGPLLLRGAYFLDTGHGSVSSDVLVVEGIAAYELLPVPIRSWGRGGGHRVELLLPIPVSGGETGVELLAGTRSHGTLTRFDLQEIEYSLGPEKYVGLRAATSPTALSRIEAGVGAVFPEPDDAVIYDSSGRAEHEGVFEPGPRLGAHVLAAFPVRRTSALLRGHFYLRGKGVDTSKPPLSSVSLIEGTRDSGARYMVSMAVETRTPLRYLPVTTTTRVRLIRNGKSGSGWLASVGVGTEVPVFGPWPGRLFLVPTATIHRGRITVADGYESTTTGWELSVSTRWVAGR